MFGLHIMSIISTICEYNFIIKLYYFVLGSVEIKNILKLLKS